MLPVEPFRVGKGMHDLRVESLNGISFKTLNNQDIDVLLTLRLEIIIIVQLFV